MRASTLYVLVATVGLTTGLYSLPRWVVQNKTKQIGNAPGGHSTGTPVADSMNVVANTGTKDESSIEHNQPLTPVQQKQVEGLQQAYATATPNVRQGAAQRLVAFFRSVSRFDSAAHYTDVIAQLAPTEQNLLRAGDQYFEAYGFAVDEKKVAYLGQKTRELYQKALEKNPNLLAAKANMAMTYVNTQTPMQGIMLLREVLQQDPTNELALFNLGMLSMRSGQYSKAIDRFRQILVNDPANRRAQFYLGVSLVETNQKEEARKVLADVKANEKDPQIQAAIKELEERVK
ncbi:tetratricopeptide repeat protein [Fibrella sp. HMF5335]|uniref:Tetratricopeptide repeat protein n=1 Tax=Fibrella rubiginis TaxID=2817060 RepID=A0A939GJL3_9BACT|nr:tetratricopeptide repeat protein [Fibrella rubiginis]MBO0938998.1 tetratricopeptide repeat protein [Fibrella rubiginis]